MDLKGTEEKGSPKKRLSLGNSKQVRAALCKLAREYHNGEIPDRKIRNMAYIYNSILGADKFINIETELTNRFEQLEKQINGSGGGTIVDPKELESPYASDLKKQLVNEQQVTAELNNEILSLKRQLAGQQAEPAQGGGIEDL